MQTRKLARGALLVALALVLQSLRLVLPLPLMLSTFIIGTLVHMMLVLTLKLNGLTTALLLGLLLPLTAYLQGQLALLFLVPVVWLGNVLFVLGVFVLTGRLRLATLLPPVIKGVVMLVGAWVVVFFLELPDGGLKRGILLGMSVPQVVTGVAGTFCAWRVLGRVRF